VFHVEERRILDARHLRDILMWVIGMNGEVREIHRGTPEIAVLLQFEGYSDVTLQISPQAIEMLAEELRVLTTLAASAAPDLLAELLAAVAMISSHSGPAVSVPITDKQHLDILANKIRTDFGIACATSLARARGHAISISKMPWIEVYWAVSNRDTDLLANVFRESLGLAEYVIEAGISDTRPDAKQDGEDDPESLIRSLENQFASIHPIPDVATTKHDRVLTAQSYWNLRSVADLERWSNIEILALIEEHLSPELHPHLVHHSATVSGDDWLRLYGWIYRSDGSVLCTLMAGSNPLSYPLRLAAFESLQ
jgi:hypothetical protein